MYRAPPSMAATTSVFAREFRAADTQSEDYPTVQALRSVSAVLIDRIRKVE